MSAKRARAPPVASSKACGKNSSASSVLTAAPAVS